MVHRVHDAVAVLCLIFTDVHSVLLSLLSSACVHLAACHRGTDIVLCRLDGPSRPFAIPCNEADARLI